MIKELVIATRNRDKLKEIERLLRDVPLKILPLDAFKNIPHIKEDALTIEENAIKKAVQVSKITRGFAIADDSGLEVDALDGKPGIFSARFSGRGATYQSNNEKLLRLLKDIPPPKRKATFKCVIAIADRGRLIDTAIGICRGMITLKPFGKSGFGYDPVFIPEGHTKTFAQMGIEEKNQISHRSRALKKAKKIILRYVL